MVLKISCTDPNVNVSALDFGEIFKGPVAERPQRGETLVALDGTHYRIEDVVISNNHSNSEYIKWRIQIEYVLKKIDVVEDTTWNDNETDKPVDTNERPKKNTKYIITFPGVGASYYQKQHQDNSKIIIISQKHGLDDVKRSYGHYDYIFVYFEQVPKFKPSDLENIWSLRTVEEITTLDVFKNVIENETFFDDKDVFVVYPDKSLKLDYIEKYRDRGDDQNFVTFVGFHWDEWITSIEKSYGEDVILYKLKKDETLTDAIEMIEKWEKTNPKS